MKTRMPDEKDPSEQEDGNADEEAQTAIESCARDLIRAVHAQDVKGASEAIQSAFAILDSMPHEEGEHYDSGSFKDQNVKAAQESK